VTVSASEVYRVEREVTSGPIGKRSPLLRGIGTALTGMPMPSSRISWAAVVRLLDPDGVVVFEQAGDQASMDALELEILNDLIRYDVEAFRARYGLPDPADG
jgi:hypothetical protein